MIKSFTELLAQAKQGPRRRVAVAAAEDVEVISALYAAQSAGIAEAFLVGDAEKIRSLAAEAHISLSGMEIIDVPDKMLAAKAAVSLVREGRAQMLMKGLIGTADILRAVLDKEQGLRSGRVLSHVAIIEVPTYHKLLFMSDGGQNIAPDLAQKAEILQNAVDIARALGVVRPKVAPLAAVEVVNPKMQATVDAYELQLMAQRGELKDCLVHGPLALDGAISAEAAEHKGIKSQVAGDVDVLLVPNIEVGNVLYKTLVYLSRARVAGLIAGATAPIVLTSRSDSPESKLLSIACASVVAGR
ncbi:MAG: phosphate butyryltransferase [Firmicutes bacterium]|nr:phosphate butyryltransferase [Dethiobacter sp.]MBS3889319.1 phosphate butyryltransferase [Bacillota bacterium]MBS4055002.1 phosphate butyryltransferase [Thermaerobacter sp.]